MFARVNDVMHPLYFVAGGAAFANAQTFRNNVLYRQIVRRPAVSALLFGFKKLQILAQNRRPRDFAVAQVAKSLFDKAVVFLFRRLIVARLHRALGNDFRILIENQILYRFNASVGHDETFFQLNTVGIDYRTH